MSGGAEGGTHTRKLTVAARGHSDGLLGRLVRQCVCPSAALLAGGGVRADARTFCFVWGRCLGAVGRGRWLCTACACAANRRGRTLGNARTGVASCWSSRGCARRGDALGKGARRRGWFERCRGSRAAESLRLRRATR